MSDTQPPAEKQVINMNDRVKLKPTRAGWEEINRSVQRFNEKMIAAGKSFRVWGPDEDCDGYIEGQFWSLMRDFDWENVHAGGDVFFTDLQRVD